MGELVMPPAALETVDLRAGHGPVEVLRGVNFRLEVGECVALLGRNGAGKTTFVNTIAGLLPVTAGDVRLLGETITLDESNVRSRKGLGLVPQGRRTFGSLTVNETLRLLDRPGRGWTRQEAYERFPRLAARADVKAGVLSGGEQSMLSIARALVTGPRVLVLDEPSEGLAMPIIEALIPLLRDIAASGVSVLMIEQNTRFAKQVADRVCHMERGALSVDEPTRT